MIKKVLLFIMTLIIIISSNYVLGIDRYNLLHGYLYDNCSGIDYGITPNNFTVYGSPTATGEIQGSSCSFSGSGQNMRLTGLNSTNTWKTIEFWIKPMTPSFYSALLELWDSWAVNTLSIQRYNPIATYFYLNSTQRQHYDYYLTNETWNHIVYVFDDEKMYIYKNAILLNWSTLPNFPVVDKFNLMAHINNEDNYKGVISRFSVFDIPFNASSVNDSYNNGNGRDWLTYNTSDEIYIPPSTTIINECNQTYTYSSTIDTLINLTWNISNGSNILYDLYLSTTQPVTANSYEYNSINDTNITISLQEIITELGFDDEYFYNIDACDEINCSTTRLNMEPVCKFYICKNNYVKSNHLCINGVRFINYTDSHNCPLLLDFPTTNNTYEECMSPATQGDIDIKNSIYVLILILIVLIVVIIKKESDKND